LTGKDFDYAVMKEYADRLQLQLQRVKDVSKVNLVGLQDQKIWIELSNTKAVQLGVPVTAFRKRFRSKMIWQVQVSLKQVQTVFKSESADTYIVSMT
jgi:multidrug efflux pump subunit AcrB